MILVRYIAKEISYIFMAVSSVLVFIGLSNQFVKYLAKAATGQLPVATVLKIITLYIPELFGFLAPISLFVAILFTLGRLYADSEAQVLLTSGFAWGFLLKTVMQVAIIIAVVVALLTTWVIPNIATYRERLITDGQAIGVVQSIIPEQFQILEGGKLVFYVEKVLGAQDLQRVFIASCPNQEQIETDNAMVVVTADAATIKQVNNEKDFYIILNNGQRYIGVPGDANYSITSFSEYGRELIYNPEPLPSFQRLISTSSLMHSNYAGDIAEFQWRLSIPLSVIVLSILAVPLSKVSPREGRYAKFLPGIILYIGYYNILTVTRRLVSTQDIYEYSMWLVHGVFLGLAILLLAHASGYLHQYLSIVKFKRRNRVE